jgi:hypothetical protein
MTKSEMETTSRVLCLVDTAEMPFLQSQPKALVLSSEVKQNRPRVGMAKL